MVLLAIWVALKLRESKARVIPSQSPSLLLLACSDRRELQLRSAMEFPVWRCLPRVCVWLPHTRNTPEHPGHGPFCPSLPARRKKHS
jgi:hypothetical protein